MIFNKILSTQVVYMIWNAVNDPLFGYLQDNSKVPCCSRRRLSILYGAPLYSLTFLLPWFPWRSYTPGDWLSGFHLMVALCAFDGMLTFVLLAQCALFAEISSNHQNRLRLVKYSQVNWTLASSFLCMPQCQHKCLYLLLIYPPCSLSGGLSYWLLQRPLLWCVVKKHGGLLSLPSFCTSNSCPELCLHALYRLPQWESLR